MIHHHFFMPKRADFTQQEFSNYYRRKHIKAAGNERIPALKRYIQSHRVDSPPSPAPYTAVAEVWYDDEAALTEFCNSPAYKLFKADELNFVDVARAENLTTVDHVILDGEKALGMVKGMFLIKRKPGMRLADFRRHWLEVHGPLAVKNMEIRRYVQCHTIDSVYNFCEPRWDGVTHLWFDDAAAAARAMAALPGNQALVEDGARFVGESLNLFVTEHILIWPK